MCNLRYLSALTCRALTCPDNLSRVIGTLSRFLQASSLRVCLGSLCSRNLLPLSSAPRPRRIKYYASLSLSLSRLSHISLSPGSHMSGSHLFWAIRTLLCTKVSFFRFNVFQFLCFQSFVFPIFSCFLARSLVGLSALVLCSPHPSTRYILPPAVCLSALISQSLCRLSHTFLIVSGSSSIQIFRPNIALPHLKLFLQSA